MPFFLIFLLWGLCVCAGLVLLIFRPTRWIAPYLILPPTLAMIVSFIASLVMMFGALKLGQMLGAGNYSGLVAVGGYAVGLLAGGGLGGLIGIAIVAFFQLRARRKRISQ